MNEEMQTKSRASLIEQVTGELFAGCTVLTIRGCRGVGKTSLGRHLASMMRAHGRPVVCASGAVHDAEQLRDLIAQAAPAGAAGGRGTERLVLFVDDAQACPAVLFGHLWSLAAGRCADEPVVQLVLIGDVGPWPGLNDPGLAALREASTSCYILVPFEDDEAAAYVRQRLGMTGWKRFSPGRRSALREIVGQSHGVPALLDALVSEALVSEAPVSKAPVSKALVFKALAPRRERLPPARSTAPARRRLVCGAGAGYQPRRMAITLGATVAIAVTLAASGIVPPRANAIPSRMPGATRLLSSARLAPAQTVFYAPLAPGAGSALDSAAAEPPAAGKAGPGLVLIASAGDDMRTLYGKVYRGLTPPPYAAVLAANRTPVRQGALIIFPEPPNGWASR